MAVIERIELTRVDLQPRVKRTDAIQSFVAQETPILRVFDRDGASGTGYSYTIGTELCRASSACPATSSAGSGSSNQAMSSASRCRARRIASDNVKP